MKIENLNKYIDHTQLGRDVRVEAIDKARDEAIEYQFKSLCIAPM
jgi:deoxyribose-phosphate aldolase